MSEGMPDVAASLEKKVGPLPGWGWVLIVGGGAWALYLAKKRSTVSAAPTVQDPTTAAVGGQPSDGSSWSNGGGIIPTGGTGPAAGPSGTPGATTNAQWARQVNDGLVATGGDPTLISNALSKYLGGQTLTSAEQSIVNKAIQAYGSPPEGVIAVQASKFTGFSKDLSTNALYGTSSDGTKVLFPTYQAFLDAGGGQGKLETFQSLSGFTWDTQGGALNEMLHPGPTTHSPTQGPAPAPAPAAPSGHAYVVKPGDSLSLIAGRFYGNFFDWQRIYDANRGVVGPNPNLIFPGQTLVIP